MKRLKNSINVIILAFAFLATSMFTPMSTLDTFAAAAGVPAAPSLNHDNWDGDGNYKITMNMWWGNNGTKFELFENGNLISTTNLTDNTPNSQTVATDISGRARGSYIYRGRLTNSFGYSESSDVTVNVTVGGSNTPTPSATPTNTPVNTPTPTTTGNSPSPTAVSKEVKLNVTDAVITSSAILYGSAENCFDSNENTVYCSQNIEPAYVQVQYPEKKTVSKLRVLLGEKGYANLTNSWWVEAADSQQDLDNKTGTYQKIVDTKAGIGGGVWDEFSLSTAVSKKIWRFSATKDYFDHIDNNVQMIELELWGTKCPMPPSDLVGTVSGSTAALSWNASAETSVTGYYVYRNNIRIADVNTTSYQDTGLVSGGQYTYVVSAHDALGNTSVRSNEVIFGGVTKKIDVLNEYKTLKVIITNTDNYAGDGKGGWTNNNDHVKDCFDGSVDKYSEIRQDGNNPVYIGLDFSTPKNVTEIKGYLGVGQNQRWSVEAADTEEDLKNKTGSYQMVIPESNDIATAQWVSKKLTSPISKKFWRFNVRNTSGNLETNLPEFELWCDDVKAPSAPKNLTAQGKDARTVQLSWTGSTLDNDISGYVVFRNGCYLGMTTGTKYTDTLLEPNTTYTYYVYAIDGTGNRSSVSNEATASTNNTMDIKTEYNVLVLRYDPIIKAGTYSYFDPVFNKTSTRTVASDTKFSQLYGSDYAPLTLVDWFKDNMKKVSGGSVNFKIVETKEMNYVPPANSPEWMNNNILIEFMELKSVWNPNTQKYEDHRKKDYDVFHHSGYNYHKAFRDNNVLQMVEDGTVDMVWIFAANPSTGAMEATMAGNGAFNTNGTPRDIVSSRKFVSLIGGSTECFGHMIDCGIRDIIFSKLPKTWNMNVLKSFDLNNQATTPALKNDYEKFELTEYYNYDPDRVAPGFSQVGTMHYPANGTGDYHWRFREENFDWNADNWRSSGGTWACEGGKYKVSSLAGAKTFLYASSSVWDKPIKLKDGTFELDITPGNGAASSNTGLIFRATNIGEGVNAFKGYYAALDASNDKVVLARIDNSFTQIDSYSMAIQPGTTYRMKVIADGTNIKVYVGDMNVAKINVNDTVFQNAGAVGLGANSTEAYFDNVYVNASVKTYADTWYNYPNLTGAPRTLDFNEWNGDWEGNTYQYWWFDHIPRNPGLHDATDIGTQRVHKGILNNWWPYIMDINRFNGDPITYEVTGFPVAPALKLKVASKTASSVSLTWTVPQNSGAVGTKVYRDGVLIKQVTGTTFTDTGLTAGKQYAYTVKTYDASGKESIATDEVYVTPN
ncbi:MAG: fibronectin type III domain-containing protein [Clostridia bacterium]|nr:fibronectin type III domain-containing protein [Clostridia bacterium]